MAGTVVGTALGAAVGAVSGTREETQEQELLQEQRLVAQHGSHRAPLLDCQIHSLYSLSESLPILLSETARFIPQIFNKDVIDLKWNLYSEIGAQIFNITDNTYHVLKFPLKISR